MYTFETCKSNLKSNIIFKTLKTSTISDQIRFPETKLSIIYGIWQSNEQGLN